MKKFLLFIFILLNGASMAAASAFLYSYATGRAIAGIDLRTFVPFLPRAPQQRPPVRPAPVTPAATQTLPAPAVPSQASTSTISTTPPPAPASEPTPPGFRKIRFSYKNDKAKIVEIRADFTGWKAEPMTRGDGGVWTYDRLLAPGEYAYCFGVDKGSKIIPDPANKRRKLIAQTPVSAIVVERR